MLTIDHIGYAVKKIDRAIDSFIKIGFIFGPVIDDKDRNIKIAFGKKDGYQIELVSPLDKKTVSPVDTYLNKVGPTSYHICYRTELLEEAIEYLKKEGFRIVLPPAEAAAFNGNRVAFMMNLYIGLVEIVEKRERK